MPTRKNPTKKVSVDVRLGRIEKALDNLLTLVATLIDDEFDKEKAKEITRDVLAQTKRLKKALPKS